jgi:Ig-like domain from next to BRCA1 gene
VPDGTTVSPGQTLNKTWQLRNCGTTNWSNLTAVRIADNYGPTSFAVPTTEPGTTINVTVPVTAPTQAGLSRTTYRLQASDGHYANNSFWVEVKVVAVSPNRQAITSYGQMRPGVPHHGYFTTAWQPFIAASNTITWISATIGNPAAAAGAVVQGSVLTLRICTDPNCSFICGGSTPEDRQLRRDRRGHRRHSGHAGKNILHSLVPVAGTERFDMGDVLVGGGNTISASDSMQAAVRGYDR